MFLGDSYVSMAVHTQLGLFLTAIVWGAGVALAYDGLRTLRRVMPTPAWLYAAEDLLFWIVEALMIFRLMFKYDDGAIRSYTMFGMILGMALYLWIFGSWLSRIAGKILGFFLDKVKKCLIFAGRLLKILSRPLKRLGKMLKKKELIVKSVEKEVKKG